MEGFLSTYKIPKTINTQKNIEFHIDSKQKKKSVREICTSSCEIETELSPGDFDQKTFYQSPKEVATSEDLR